MNEADLQKLVMVALGSRQDVRIFRNNVGMGWQGKLIENRNGRIVLAGARPLHAGLIVGSGDLIGWQTINGVARFLSVEIKAPHGRVSPQQIQWRDAVNRAGGIAGIVRTVDEAVGLVEK